MIYLTLPLTPVVAKMAYKLIGKKETGLIISIVLLSALGGILVIMFRRIKKHLRWWAALPFLATAILATTMDNPTERIHFFEYGLLAFLLFRAAGRPTGQGLVWVYVSVVLAGFSDECIQWMLPNRFFDLRDVGMNAVGAAIGLWFGVMILRPEQVNASPVTHHDSHRL
ncbi:MAG: VanZ family protein [Magnetococcus sp. YQC-5]